MQINCSFCKSPIDSSSEKCEWCGSNDPVDKIAMNSKIQTSQSTVYISRDLNQEDSNKKRLNIFLQDISNINSLHKTSSNKGLFGSLMDKLEGSNLEKRKIDLINNFNEKMDDDSIDLIFRRVNSEHIIFLKNKSSRENIFNPSSSQELFSKPIMLSWISLLKNNLKAVHNPDLKNEISLLINNY